MGRPSTRAELLDRAQSQFDKLIAEVDRLEPTARLQPGACESWSVKDILAHLDAWHELFLDWERAGVAGERPALPATGYSWKETPQLNEAMWQRTRDDGYDDVIARLRDSHARVRVVIASYDDAALFEKARYAWTGSTSVGSYAVSATTSHYDWATKLIRRFAKARTNA